MSKTYGLAGLRIGWVATHDRALLQKLASLKDYTTICNSAPSEFLAELALRHREKLAVRTRAIIRRNLALLDEFFGRRVARFHWVRPKAGPIAFPKFMEEDIEVFCRRLAARAGVLLLPGTLFEDTGNHFRIGFGRMNMPEALGLMERFITLNPV
jgi:aspartate/methionine/tyrosine aminotransferase